ncbi:MAG: hypothetical protein A4E63_01946 [Syntrophorhabdus sp. PtaU1.Bin050]|nr:MAG: hypothetical protein A4E63_01946 [Syntrophorhabdus sp. PtaU1.Bin050]
MGLNPIAFAPASPKSGFIPQDEVDPVYLTGEAQKFLGMAYIHEQERLTGRVWKETKDIEITLGCRDNTAGSYAQLGRKPVFYEDGALFTQKIHKLPQSPRTISGRWCIPKFGTDNPVEKGIDAQKPDRITAFKPHLTVQHRRKGLYCGIIHQIFEGLFLHGSSRAFYDVG